MEAGDVEKVFGLYRGTDGIKVFILLLNTFIRGQKCYNKTAIDVDSVFKINGHILIPANDLNQRRFKFNVFAAAVNGFGQVNNDDILIFTDFNGIHQIGASLCNGIRFFILLFPVIIAQVEFACVEFCLSVRNGEDA